MKSRIVYQTYTEKKVTPSRYVPGMGAYDYGYSVTTGEDAYFVVTNDLKIKELIVDEFYIRPDGFVEVKIEGSEFADEPTILTRERILAIEPYDKPRTEPVEKGRRVS